MAMAGGLSMVVASDDNSTGFSEDESLVEDVCGTEESVVGCNGSGSAVTRSVLKESTNVTPTAAPGTWCNGPAKRLPFQSPRSATYSKNINGKSSVERRLCEILDEVKETKGRIAEWDKKFTSIERRLTMLESPVTSSSDDLGTPQRRKVPNHVRVNNFNFINEH